MKRFFFLSFVLVMTILPFQAVAQDSVKIGCVLPYTGALAWQGQETFRGTQIAADMQNKRGGVLGKKIVLVKGDSETLKSAVSETERLINEGIKLFCGEYSSSRPRWRRRSRRNTAPFSVWSSPWRMILPKEAINTFFSRREEPPSGASCPPNSWQGGGSQTG